jgi:rubrerythrin
MKESPDSEIFDFAIAREVGAYNFYIQLSKRQTDAVAKDLFKSLADEELEHKSKLEFEVIKQGRVVKHSEDWSEFEKIYPSIDVENVSDISYREAFRIAIEKEEMSFRLYADMAASMTDEQSRDMLYSLAEEEVNHKLRCTAQYNTLIEWGG